MKILYICHNLGTFILSEAIQINRQGHDVLIIGENTSQIYETINKPMLERNGLDKHFYGLSSASSRQEKYSAFIKKLIYDFLVHPIYASKACFYLIANYEHPKLGIVDYLDIRNFFGSRIGLIHAPFSVPTIINKVYLLSKVLNVPYTLSFKAHDIWQGSYLDQTKKQIKEIKEASQIFTIATFNKTYLQSQLDTDKEIHVIHDAIDVDFFKSTNQDRSPNSIVAVSRLSPEKGLMYLIKACHILHQRQIAYSCTIIGDGPERPRLDSIIEELQIPDIHFTGFLSQDQVKERLQTSMVYVLPSIVDSDGLGDVLPNGVKEAMSMQLPVITSDIRGIDELVTDGLHGVVVPPGNPKALADAIQETICEPAKARKMGEAGRKMIEMDFNLRTEVGKIEKVFENALIHVRN